MNALRSSSAAFVTFKMSLICFIHLRLPLVSRLKQVQAIACSRHLAQLAPTVLDAPGTLSEQDLMYSLKAFTPTASPCCLHQRHVCCSSNKAQCCSSKTHLRSQTTSFAGTAGEHAQNDTLRHRITPATSSSCCSSRSRCCSSPQLTTTQQRHHRVATSAAAAAGGFTDDHRSDFWTWIHVLPHHIRQIVSSQYLPIALVCALALGAVNPSLGLAASRMHIPALATFGIFVVQVRTQQPAKAL